MMAQDEAKPSVVVVRHGSSPDAWYVGREETCQHCGAVVRLVARDTRGEMVSIDGRYMMYHWSCPDCRIGNAIVGPPWKAAQRAEQ